MRYSEHSVRRQFPIRMKPLPKMKAMKICRIRRNMMMQAQILTANCRMALRITAVLKMITILTIVFMKNDFY